MLTRHIFLMLFSCLLFAACGGGGGDNAENQANEVAQTSVADDAAEDLGEVVMEEEVVVNEVDARDGTFASDPEGVTIDLTVQFIEGSNGTGPPSSATCLGDISVVIDTSLVESLTGEGSCLTSGNSASYTLTAAFTSATEFSGELTIIFSGREHVIPLTGTIDGDTITATFAGTTDQINQIEIVWDGSFAAVRVVL